MSPTKLNPTLFWLGLICIILGLGIIVAGFFLSEQTSNYHNPFLAYLATSLGGLLVFGASYTLLSEGFLRRDFAREMNRNIDAKLREARNDQSILESGLLQILPVFSHQTLHERVRKAQSVKMVVVKNTMYFREYRESLRKRIAAGQLNLEIAVPDISDTALMEIVARRYDEFSGGAQLASSIADCVDVWLKEKLFDELPDNSKEKLLVYATAVNPVYSAYLFDREELWYIPYHSRMGRHGIPVYVYRGVSDVLPLYRDILHLFQAAHPWDLRRSMKALVSSPTLQFAETRNETVEGPIVHEREPSGRG